MKRVEVNKLFSLTGHKDSVYTIIQGRKPHEIYSAGGDGWVVQWDLNEVDQGKLVAKTDNSIYALALDTDSNELILGHNQDGIHFIDLESFKESRSVGFTQSAIFDLYIDHNLIFAGCQDGEMVVIDKNTLSVLHRSRPTQERLRSFAFHPTRPEFAAGFSDNYIRIYDRQNFREITSFQAHANSIFALKYIPSGQLLSVGRDARIRLWSNQYEQLHEIPAHMYTINDLAFRSDYKYFVTCSLDKTIKLWRTKDFKLLKVIDKGRHAGHGTSVNKLVWTPFHNYLLSASDDRTISGWDIQINEELI